MLHEDSFKDRALSTLQVCVELHEAQLYIAATRLLNLKDHLSETLNLLNLLLSPSLLQSSK